MKNYQLKLIIPTGIHRFTSQGQPLIKIDQPFIEVEVQDKETVECLYDQSAEHLSQAFTCDAAGNITGLDVNQCPGAVARFLANDTAWYMEKPKLPAEDMDKPVPSPVEKASATAATAIPASVCGTLTPAELQVIEQVLQNWTGQRVAFTVFEVSLEAKKRGVQRRHRDMREAIHNHWVLRNAINQGTYDITMLEVGQENGQTLKAALYHPEHYDPQNYTPLERH